LQSDIATPLCTLNVKDSIEVNSKDGTDAELLTSQTEEGIFFDSTRFLPIQSLPSMLRAANTNLPQLYIRLEHDARSYLIEYEMRQKSADLLKLIKPIIGKLMITNISDFNQSALQHFLALDYAPSLRNMAYLESIAEKHTTITRLGIR